MNTEDYIKRIVDAAPPLTLEQRVALQSRLGQIPKVATSRPHNVEPQEANPFGRWSKYRAQIAAFARADAGSEEQVAQARQMLAAARLADTILKVRGGLSAEQRRILANLLEDDS